MVLADTEDTWRELFRRAGGSTEDPKLVLFSGAVQSACGFAQAAVGPFYCPADQKVYIDLGFYRELRDRFQAPGRFRAGLRDRARGRPSRAEPARHLGRGAAPRSSARRSAKPTRCRCGSSCRPTASPASGRITRNRRAPDPRAGDVEAGLNAAAAIGDDRLQRQAQRLRRRRTRSRTAARSSACTGSSAAWRRAERRRAIRSLRLSCSRCRGASTSNLCVQRTRMKRRRALLASCLCAADAGR